MFWQQGSSILSCWGMGGRMGVRGDCITHLFKVLCPLPLCWRDPPCDTGAEQTGRSYVLYHAAKLFSLMSTKWNRPNVQTHPRDLQLSHCQGIAFPNIRWWQRMTSPTAFDNFTLGLTRPRLGRKDMAVQALDCYLWPGSIAAGSCSCESSLTQTAKHMDLKYDNDRVNNKKWTSKCHWNILMQWPEPALHPLHTTGKGQEMSRAGKGTGLSGHDCTRWGTDRQATQLLLEESGWLMEVVYPR